MRQGELSGFDRLKIDHSARNTRCSTARMYLKNMARPERFELPTLWFEARCSIQLSYGRVKVL